ncbi:MAG TPA: helix-turn-helix domain-containing protein [Candidimonas sp.]|nr:helix-turn-helix domain-containing protein [Candidimonas sp.]
MPKSDSALPADPNSTHGVAAVNRALSIVCCFGNDDKSLSLAELSQRTGLYKSTILRMVESLEQFNILARDPDNGYRLGIELVRLGALAKRVAGNKVDIDQILSELVALTGESATYYIRRGDYRLALFRVDSNKSLRDHIKPGDLLVLGKGAAGRVLADLRGFPERKDPFEVIASLGERDPEIAAIAGPVFQDGAVIGAISISGPRTRFTPEAVQRHTKVVREACRKLSLTLDPELELRL